MSKFKIGDRVIFNKGKDDEDRGVIVERYDHDTFFYGDVLRWYVRWDSDGDKLHCSETDLDLENPTVIIGMPEVLVINGVRYVRSE